MSARIKIVELRTEEHHGEWAGTKYFEPKNLFCKNREPGHVTTLKSPN